VGKASLRVRVERVADAVLADQHCVAPVDVLRGLGWLAPAREDEWRQGRLPSLERGVQASLGKISTAMSHLRRWAASRGLQASETTYVSRTRDRRQLRFSVSGDPGIERAYRTHWVSPSLSDAKRQRLADRQSRPPDLVVVRAINDWACAECSATGELLIMDQAGPLCLPCADLDHLVYLEAGNAALTRRAKRTSKLSAVVVRFSRTRKRYERQGILVERNGAGSSATSRRAGLRPCGSGSGSVDRARVLPTQPASPLCRRSACTARCARHRPADRLRGGLPPHPHPGRAVGSRP
jgi:hypothetical protein